MNRINVEKKPGSFFLKTDFIASEEWDYKIGRYILTIDSNYITFLGKARLDNSWLQYRVTWSITAVNWQ